MSWEDEHERRISRFPPGIRKAHTHSSQHRSEIEASQLCGCFYCCSTFPPGDIVEWVDEDGGGKGQTALCPKCGIDSVIGDRSGFDVSRVFLSAMKSHWF